MNITVFRIDERLIHGQIVTAWIAYAEANQIIVADDKAANDEFQKSLLQMATPKNINLKIVGLEEAITMIKEDTSDTKVLLLVRGPKEALQMIEGGIDLKEINIGNINMKKGKKKVLGNLWVDDEDIRNLTKLSEAGVSLDIRTVPNERSQDAMKLILK
ncbi:MULTISPECIES: PTS system mannose/fructose/N-acetylgalactosamine-transporter subunit IIB [Bacillaceae]|uniref:PTS system mannose/fructose/N-acetylgalactosamine-transporter subunit IIB n=1 Tax=Bacillaceae TaxID=186817 RepID=UPI00118C846E|nr:PTS sugar transporter subunit IIB [Bacillus sp. S3]QCJ44418.1 PTS sugar transporter subunit IIB [Bacillus sp. S3]